jgi:antirestriction protein ArdC
MNRQTIYSRITDTILSKLKKGTIPWKRSWKIGLPANYISKRIYSGINFLSLLVNDFASPYYLTYLQCSKKQGKILKGAKGIPIIFWKITDIANKDIDDMSNEVKQVPIARLSYVFNLTQTDLYKDNADQLKIYSCESIIEGLGDNRPVVKHNPVRSYYSSKKDYISIPHIDDFDNPDEYYSTLFHELIHWTGNINRLNRLSIISDVEKYSLEELTAEIGSAYLCGLTGIESNVIDNQSSYIEGWYRNLQSNPDVLIKASLQAQRAVDYILKA